MAWHRYTLVVIGLTASLCIQTGKSDDDNTGQTPAPEAVCDMQSCLSGAIRMLNEMRMSNNTCGDLNEVACRRFIETPDGGNATWGLDLAVDALSDLLLANGMMQKMNMSADPCEDFNEFACGRFNEKIQIPQGRSEVWALTTVADVNTLKVHDMIIQEVKPTDPQYLINIKRFYKSCFDEDAIATVGLTPYLTDMEFIDDWPTLNPNWTGVNFNLNEVIARYSKVFINPIFHLASMNDIADNNRMAIYLFGATFNLDQKTYNLPRNDTILQAYEKYLVEIARVLDANWQVAKRDVKDVVDLEIELAKIMVPEKEQRDIAKIYNPVPLIELSTMYPELDIVGFVRTVFGLVNKTIADNETIINLFPTYIGNISRIVNKFSNRTMQNLFGFNYALNRVGVLTRRMRTITQDFDKVYYGTIAEPSRCKFCVDSTSIIFSEGIAKKYLSNHFSETAKQNVNNMIDKFKQVFHNMIEEATWMSNATKTEALEKLTAMNREIGYPDVGYEEAVIEEQYRHYIMKSDNYYSNKILGNQLSRLADLATYGKPANKNKWFLPPHETNAYYGYLNNEIVFLAGILQPPFYSEKFIPAMNYGAIGTVIGYEIMNGFDDEGKQFDENGTFRNWWAPGDQEYFKNKTQCIADQISEIYIDEINMTLNGEHTKGKSMDDIGALKLAFRAYKKYVNTFAQPSQLPGLYLSRDQLFFVSFAQLFCGKYTRQGLVYSVKSGKNLPSKYRMLGALQNSEDFAKAYNCPKGSSMNPVHKCNVW